MSVHKNILYPALADYVNSLDTGSISGERREVLEPLINAIRQKVNEGVPIRLNLICTHNSRRSHFAQVWAQVAAAYNGFTNVYCYSGGTEATTVYPVVLETLKNTGFTIQVLANGENPVYAIKFGDSEHPVIGFSKTYYNEFNPESGFIAVMTCSQADGGCPFVSGADQRIPVTYDDPKAFDGTPQQAGKYSERSAQIATEMFYVFSRIKR